MASTSASEPAPSPDESQPLRDFLSEPPTVSEAVVAHIRAATLYALGDVMPDDIATIAPRDLDWWLKRRFNAPLHSARILRVCLLDPNARATLIAEANENGTPESMLALILGRLLVIMRSKACEAGADV